MCLNKRLFIPIMRCTAALLLLLSQGARAIAPLTNRTLAMLDGVYSAFDGETVRGSLTVRMLIRNILLGNVQGSTRQGAYLLEGKRLSLQQIAEIEQRYYDEYMHEQMCIDERYVNMQTVTALIEAERARLLKEKERKLTEQVAVIERKYTDSDLLQTECWKSDRMLAFEVEEALDAYAREIKRKHCKDIAGYEQALADARTRFVARIAPILEVLKKIRSDFIEVNAPFMEQTMGTKTLLLQLIEEFCCKHNLPRSFLLEWASVPDGDEIPFFEQSMTNTRILAQFCADLTLFLEDLVNSCPKGMAQFKKLTTKK
jgi:hypothetical protein